MESLTFLFTDIEGSTVRWERFPVDMRAALARHDALLRDAIAANGGVVFKTIGDAFCAVFTKADNALAAAVAIHLALASEDFAAVDGIAVRIALHSGVAERRDDDYFGPNVNRVARLLAVGHGGQVLLSEAARERLSESALLDIALEDLGTHRLKDLSKPEHVTLARPPGMTRRFPPLRSVGALAHNLPVQVTSFVGREREVEEITELVRQHRLVTLTGAGGTGKTRASLYAAANVSDGSVGNIWFIELAGLGDGALIPLAIASTIGIVLRSDLDQTEALVREIRDQTMLLVLDNCEHLIESAAEAVAALLRGCGRVRVLTSSREPLAIPGEFTYRMPSLATPKRGSALTPESALSFSAISLFVDRASAADRRFALSDDNVEVVADICRRLDGIALAIELAAARVRVLSPRQIDARLGERFRVLVGGDRAALPRQKTLRALVDWSYDLLSLGEQRALCELSVFAGSFTIDAAEAVFGEANASEAIDLLTGLVDKSLLSSNGDVGGDMRYQLLESIRAYAFEKLTDAGGLGTLERRVFAWALERMRGAHDAWEVEPTDRWQRNYADDLDNIRAALAWSLESRNDVSGGRRLAALSRRFWGRVAPSEGRYWLDLAAPSSDEHLVPELSASLALARAQLLVALRQHQPALAAARAAIDYFENADTPALGEAKMFAGYTLALLGHLPESKSLLRDSIDIFSRFGAHQLSASAALDLALVCLNDTDPSEARELFEDAIRKFSAIENERGVVASIVNLAELEFIHRNAGVALDLIDRALALAPDTPDASTYHNNRSAYCIALERWTEAFESATSGLALARGNGVGIDIAFALQRFAAIAVLRDGDFDRAAILMGYVDARIEELQGVRQFTEREEYDRIRRVVEQAIGARSLSELASKGASSSEDEAIRFAASPMLDREQAPGFAS
jgi:predicted ATPase/class 3 adenylate cyclase